MFGRSKTQAVKDNAASGTDLAGFPGPGQEIP